MLFADWVEESGAHRGSWVAPADMDWFRILGLARAGTLQIESRYLRTETITSLDEDDEE